MAGNSPKLTPEQYAEAVRRFAAGETICQLAVEFGVSENALRNRMSRQTRSLGVAVDGKELSYRENLQWALAAAGEFLRTKKRPVSCPNDSAWFLYCQAIEEPKDFMAKVGQIEAKNLGDETEQNARIHARRAIEEIDAMLFEIDQGESDGQEKAA